MSHLSKATDTDRFLRGQPVEQGEIKKKSIILSKLLLNKSFRKFDQNGPIRKMGREEERQVTKLMKVTIRPEKVNLPDNRVVLDVTKLPRLPFYPLALLRGKV